tara:strand:- start:294 stop:458 length:165 start_codon:yes stop_codon:yes gene_type:complete
MKKNRWRKQIHRSIEYFKRKTSGQSEYDEEDMREEARKKVEKLQTTAARRSMSV